MKGIRNNRVILPPLRLFAGNRCLEQLESELRRTNAQRAVVLCGKTLATNDALKTISAAGGNRIIAIAETVQSGSPRSAVEVTTRELAASNADAIIAVGGGSAMVTARAAAILLAENEPLDELCTRRDPNGNLTSPRLEAAKVPIIALPTTPTTATIKPGTAVHDEDTGSRLALFDPKTRPQAIFLDPQLLMTAPDTLVFSAGLNSFCSAIEGLASNKRDLHSEAMLIQSVRLFRGKLGRSEFDAEARLDLVNSAIMCGRGTDNTGAGLATVLSHAVATTCKIDVGVAKAGTLPHVMRFNRNHVSDGYKALAFALSCPPHSVEKTVHEFLLSLELPQRLRDFGITHSALKAISEKCMEDWLIKTNPRPVKEAGQILDFLENVW